MSTYDRASSQIAQYVQPLQQGALLPSFESRDENGRILKISDDHLSGQSILLVFFNRPDVSQYENTLQRLSALSANLTSLNTTVIAVSADSTASKNKSLKDKTGFNWPILSDSTGAIFATHGLHKNNGPLQRIVMLTPYGQIRAWWDGMDDFTKKLETIMSTLEHAEVAAEAAWNAPHAPVLLVPNVLSQEECEQLILSTKQNIPFMVRPPRPGEISGDYKIPVYEHNRQDRVDQIIKTPATLSSLDEKIFGRVVPMIKKAFAFDVTRREDLHIACYKGERGGNKMGHRDNTSQSTAYRRFAFSMNLNDNYDGGEVVFREYSPKGYKPPPGTALVFSSSLLHEVTETTSGTRYTLISHFFNEQSLQAK